MFKKRLFSYVIDILILGFVVSIISSFIPINDTINNLNNELKDVSVNFLDGKIDLLTYFHQFSSIGYDLDKSMFINTLITIFVSVCYFVVYPIYNDGSTIGKKLNGIKIVMNDESNVSSNALIFRYLFINSIGSSILSLCLIFICKDFCYMVLTGILGFLQFLVVIISIFMVLYRRDGRSIPDLVAGTRVIEVKK